MFTSSDNHRKCCNSHLITRQRLWIYPNIQVYSPNTNTTCVESWTCRDAHVFKSKNTVCPVVYHQCIFAFHIKQKGRDTNLPLKMKISLPQVKNTKTSGLLLFLSKGTPNRNFKWAIISQTGTKVVCAFYYVRLHELMSSSTQACTFLISKYNRFVKGTYHCLLHFIFHTSSLFHVYSVNICYSV